MTNQAAKTTTIYGKKYKEGDNITNNLHHFTGLTIKILPDPATIYKLVLVHIPDELADEEEPVKEPETLTLEEARESDGVYLIHPVTKDIVWIIPDTINAYYTLAAHIAAGHNIYPTSKDAQRAKNRGWS